MNIDKKWIDIHISFLEIFRVIEYGLLDCLDSWELYHKTVSFLSLLCHFCHENLRFILLAFLIISNIYDLYVYTVEC